MQEWWQSASKKVLRRCGDDLTHENAMKQAANLNLEIGILLPGMQTKTGTANFAPIEQFQMMRFREEAGSCSDCSSALKRTLNGLRGRTRRMPQYREGADLWDPTFGILRPSGRSYCGA